jgi:hypothetical protein
MVRRIIEIDECLSYGAVLSDTPDPRALEADSANNVKRESGDADERTPGKEQDDEAVRLAKPKDLKLRSLASCLEELNRGDRLRSRCFESKPDPGRKRSKTVHPNAVIDLTSD